VISKVNFTLITLHCSKSDSTRQKMDYTKNKQFL